MYSGGQIGARAMGEKSKDEKVTKLGQLQALGRDVDELRESAADKAAKAARALRVRDLEWELLIEQRCKFARKMRLNPKVYGESPWYRDEDWIEGRAKDRDAYVGPPDGPAVMGNLGPIVPVSDRVERARLVAERMRGMRSAPATTDKPVAESNAESNVVAPSALVPPVITAESNAESNAGFDRKAYQRELMRKRRAVKKDERR